MDYVSNEVFRKINTYSRAATSMKQITRQFVWKIQIEIYKYNEQQNYETKDCSCNNYITKLLRNLYYEFRQFLSAIQLYFPCVTNVRPSHFCIANLAFLPTTPLNSSSPTARTKQAVALKRQRTTVEDLLNSTAPPPSPRHGKNVPCHPWNSRP